MNKIKQIIMFCLLCVIGMAAEAETIPNNEIWYTISKGGGYVKLNENRYDFGANVISNEYDYKKNIYIIKFDGDVTTIGEGSFYDCKSLASIIIPNSVTSIGETAFEYCSSLTSINIPNSVTSIGNDAFWGCNYEV